MYYAKTKGYKSTRIHIVLFNDVLKSVFENLPFLLHHTSFVAAGEEKACF